MVGPPYNGGGPESTASVSITACVLKMDVHISYKTHNIEMTERSRYWSVTINNPTPADDENIVVAKCRGWKVEGQIEKGENETTHYQLMVDTHSQQRFAALKKTFPRAHLEPARNPLALQKYVHKEETRTGEITTSDYYPTSLSQYWILITEAILRTHGGDTDEPLKEHRRDPLILLDKMTKELISQGYHVESFSCNPQTRQAFKYYQQEIIKRSVHELSRRQDKKTDKTTALESEEDNSDNEHNNALQETTHIPKEEELYA